MFASNNFDNGYALQVTNATYPNPPSILDVTNVAGTNITVLLNLTESHRLLNICIVVRLTAMGIMQWSVHYIM